MRLFSDNPRSSITIYIDKLSNIDEIEWFQFQQLTESIIMQESGPKEAIEAIRKKLKHGTFNQKLRVLDILKLLMENSNHRFHRELVTNAKMKDRFDAILESKTEDNKVKITIINLLGMWSAKYKREPGMKSFGQMYDRNRLNKLYPINISKPTPLSSPSIKQKPSSLDTPPIKAICSHASRQHDGGTIKNIPAPNHIASPQHHFDLEINKSKIIQDIALANQSAHLLINAFLHHQQPQDIDALILKCEESKKKIVRYTRCVKDEEWMGALLTTNDELLKALEMSLEDPFADPV